MKYVQIWQQVWHKYDINDGGTQDTSRYQWRCSSVFFVNVEHISHLFLVFLLMALKCLLRQSKQKGEKSR